MHWQDPGCAPPFITIMIEGGTEKSVSQNTQQAKAFGDLRGWNGLGLGLEDDTLQHLVFRIGAIRFVVVCVVQMRKREGWLEVGRGWEWVGRGFVRFTKYIASNMHLPNFGVRMGLA